MTYISAVSAPRLTAVSSIPIAPMVSRRVAWLASSEYRKPDLQISDSLAGLWANHCADGFDTVGGEPSTLCMLANDFRVWRVVDAIDLVAGHVAMQPLDLGA